MAVRDRLHRSELAVPGTNARAIEKAPTLGADVVFLDLEDAVPLGQKAQARKHVIQALNDLDWAACSVSVRINALDTPWCYRDVVEVVEGAGDRLDLLLVPKVGRRSDVEFVAALLSRIERGGGRRGDRPPIGIEVLIETALGVTNVEAIARAAPDRLEAMAFGPADYAASVGARTTGMGRASSDYVMLTDADDRGSRERHWGDPWHYPLSHMVAACRANDLRPIDGAFGDYRDPDGYAAAARRAAALGCEGKWAIHPSQISPANEVFTPSRAELERAEQILQAMRVAAKEGRGAVSLDGAVIDAASVRQAENLVRKAEQIARRAARPNLADE